MIVLVTVLVARLDCIGDGVDCTVLVTVLMVLLVSELVTVLVRGGQVIIVVLFF
jgi:hypothetical protein